MSPSESTGKRLRLDEFMQGLARQAVRDTKGGVPLVIAQSDKMHLGFTEDTHTYRDVCSFGVDAEGLVYGFQPYADARVGDWHRVELLMADAGIHPR